MIFDDQGKPPEAPQLGAKICPLLSSILIMPVQSGPIAEVRQMVAPQLVNAVCANAACRLWIQEQAECSLVLLAKKEVSP